MVYEKRFLLIAHYHQSGIIRKDVSNLIKTSNNYFEEVILISTRLTKFEKQKLPKFIKIIMRPNYGYFFYIYLVSLQFQFHLFLMV